MEEETTILAKFNNPYEAYILKGVLEANGIIAGVLEDATATALLANQEHGKVRVIVRKEELDRAREIMNTVPPIESAPTTE